MTAISFYHLPPRANMSPYTPPYALDALANHTHRHVSIVVPAYKEQPNLRPLCERVMKATKDAGLGVWV